jgi:hypothetical protein
MDPDRGAKSGLAIDRDMAVGLLGKPNPLPLLTSLVVKKGSNARASTAFGMPLPLSVTAITT